MFDRLQIADEFLRLYGASIATMFKDACNTQRELFRLIRRKDVGV